MGALNSKSPYLPTVQESTFQPVLNMGNLDFLQSEPFEARGLASGAVSAGLVGPASAATFELRAIAPGGIVIERFLVRYFGVAQLPDLLIRESTTALLHQTAFGNPTDTLQLGGVGAMSTFEYGAITNAFFPDLPGAPRIQSSELNIEGLRWYIGSGSFLAIQVAQLDVPCSLSVLWREVQEPI